VAYQRPYTFARLDVPEANVVVDGSTGEKTGASLPFGNKAKSRNTPFLRQRPDTLIRILVPDVDLSLESRGGETTVPQRATIPGINDTALQCLKTFVIGDTPDANGRVVRGTRKPILAERPNAFHTPLVPRKFLGCKGMRRKHSWKEDTVAFVPRRGDFNFSGCVAGIRLFAFA
jgi:hypothetical protein